MAKNEKALAQAHPEEPWLWKKDWVNGVVRNSVGTLVGPLLFAAVWSAFCVPMWFILLSGKADRTEAAYLWWFTLAFSTVDLVLITWAVVSLLRWRKYGRSVFEMASVPGVIGGRLVGVIRIPVKIEAEEYFRISLNCINVTTSHGSENRTSRRLVWQDEQVIARDMLQHEAGLSAVPVLFRIPFDCRQTDERNGDDMI